MGIAEQPGRARRDNLPLYITIPLFLVGMVAAVGLFAAVAWIFS